MRTYMFHVDGMTRSHCVGAVTKEVSAIPCVEKVGVDLVAGGTSTVTVAAGREITDAQVAAALDEAGAYRLA